MAIKHTKKHLRLQNLRGGFTLLYAFVIISLVLSFGFAIFNITIKELQLSSLARDSVFAFYAADTGMECALYWEIIEDAYATSTSSDIECAGQAFSGMGGNGYDNPDVIAIDFATVGGDPLPYCVEVSVQKHETPRYTLIESRGYNTCDTNNPRRVERALRARY